MDGVIDLYLVLGRDDFLKIGKETASPASKICTGCDIVPGVGKFKIHTPFKLFKLRGTARFDEHFYLNMHRVLFPGNNFDSPVLICQVQSCFRIGRERTYNFLPVRVGLRPDTCRDPGKDCSK